METPRFSESTHYLITSLANSSDIDLLDKFQNYPEQGKFFTAIFCRYAQIVYSLIAQAQLSQTETNYLFALIWRQFFYEMRGLSLGDPKKPELNSLQNWLIYSTGSQLKEKKLPLSETITYNLTLTPPPFWCYLQAAVDQLPPLMRFILVASENFHWSQTRLRAYLQAEGENLSQLDIEVYLKRAYELIISNLPQDIYLIYLASEEPQSNVSTLN